MKKIIIFLTALLLALGSCQDFLEQDLRSELNYDNYFMSERDLTSFADGMFGGLITWTWTGGGLFFNNYWVLQDLASDNCYETGPSIDMLDLSQFTFDVNNATVYYVWVGCYEVINSTNVLLEESENIKDYSKPEIKNHLQGEAYFLRGMLYFDLVRLFGDVPLQLFSTKTASETQIARTPVAQVYESVISDLEKAEQLLAVNPFPDRVAGIPTSMTASALLAKVYLTRGALNNNAADFASAKTCLEKVLGHYTLEPEYADIFKISKANSGEILWAINFSGTLGEGWTTNQFIVRLMPTTISDNGTRNGQGWERPLDILYDSFSETDERKAATFITEFEGEAFDGPFIRKYWDQEAEGGRQNGESDADYIYLRYSDVLLMYAEVLNEINNGPTVEAYNAINDIRDRAGLDDLADGMSYQAFKDAVLQERQWEFVMEGHRWFDLVRMGKLMDRVQLAKPTANIQAHHILFPIPQKERYLNRNLTQNEGYN
ncbi:MAG: RagB/SusD family nutrient uptake outer membrane protein [Bacteroidales bacterium]|nr:RagB/SusD family nutrient uptake outer membrane protein [Bacteroidales bacterium]